MSDAVSLPFGQRGHTRHVSAGLLTLLVMGDSLPGLAAEPGWQASILFGPSALLVTLGNAGLFLLGLLWLFRRLRGARQQVSQALQEAREATEEARRSQREILETVGQKMRTPLSGVLGMSSLLLHTPLTPEQRESVETIRQSGDALLTVINSLLDASALETGTLHLERLDFDVQATVGDVVTLAAEQARSKGLDLGCLVAGNLPTRLHGDPGRLRQVLTQLVENALKFTATGAITVRVTLAEESATEVLLRFAVHDTGMGLAPEAQQQVFQPNALRHCLTAPSYRHSGLGLVICKHLVDLMGGQIGFESRPGQGSTVWCTGRFGKGTEPSEAVRHTPTWLQSARVLCVDDHAFDRTLLHQQLLAWGMQVDCVADGLSALAHLRSAQADGEPYTLALLDLMMPSMDGRMLARAIKGDPALSTVRLVLLTTANQQAQAELARPLGFAATLTKPLHPTQLYACLLGLLGGTEAAERRTPVLPPAREAEAPRRRLRVLLAEDNFINQKVAVRLLEKLGCQVDIAANGHEALQALERTTYALVFMDCHMPEMDGYAATRAIRQREALTGAHIPIIAMTAHARQGAREQCLAAGMDDYVSKPVLSEQLAAIVQQWTPAAAPDTSCAAAVRPCALASAGPAVVL